MYNLRVAVEKACNEWRVSGFEPPHQESGSFFEDDGRELQGTKFVLSNVYTITMSLESNFHLFDDKIPPAAIIYDRISSQPPILYFRLLGQSSVLSFQEALRYVEEGTIEKGQDAFWANSKNVYEPDTEIADVAPLKRVLPDEVTSVFFATASLLKTSRRGVFDMFNGKMSAEMVSDLLIHNKGLRETLFDGQIMPDIQTMANVFEHSNKDVKYIVWTIIFNNMFKVFTGSHLHLEDGHISWLHRVFEQIVSDLENDQVEATHLLLQTFIPTTPGHPWLMELFGKIKYDTKISYFHLFLILKAIIKGERLRVLSTILGDGPKVDIVNWLNQATRSPSTYLRLLQNQ
jgi:hypothetical protein